MENISISLPQQPRYIALGENFGKFEIDGCYPGYGATLGNTLRRVLLSSLDGAAITSIKINNVSHEFSTLPGVLEDIVRIILNLKKVRFRMHGNEPVRVSLKAKGEGEVCAEKLHTPSSLEVVNGKQVIATLTNKKAELEMELTVERGIGYVPVEHQERKEKEIGVIAIDAIYTPIERVNYTVENMRIGKRTDFDRITLEILTDGSISPEIAFNRAVTILIEQFSSLFPGQTIAEEVVEAVSSKERKEESEIEGDLKGFSARTRKVLEANFITSLSDISALTEEDVKNFSGMGEKGLEEVKRILADSGLGFRF